MVTQALFWMGIVPHGAPIPLANSQACVTPLLSQIRCVCVCSCKVNWSGWKTTYFFSEPPQAVPVPPLGSQPHRASCCKGGSGRQWEQEAMSRAVGTKPIKHIRQHYHQMWNQGLPLYVLQRNKGSHNSAQRSAGSQTLSTDSPLCRTLQAKPQLPHSCYASPWSTQRKVGVSQSCNYTQWS